MYNGHVIRGQIVSNLKWLHLKDVKGSTISPRLCDKTITYNIVSLSTSLFATFDTYLFLFFCKYAFIHSLVPRWHSFNTLSLHLSADEALQLRNITASSTHQQHITHQNTATANTSTLHSKLFPDHMYI